MAALPGRAPTHRNHFEGEFQLFGITRDRAVAFAVARVSDELPVPNPDARLSIQGRGKYGDCGTDFSAISCKAKVCDAGVEDIIRLCGRPRVYDLKFLPE